MLFKFKVTYSNFCGVTDFFFFTFMVVKLQIVPLSVIFLWPGHFHQNRLIQYAIFDDCFKCCVNQLIGILMSRSCSKMQFKLIWKIALKDEKFRQIWTMWFYHRVRHPNDAFEMTNRVQPDQTAPRNSLIWIYTVCSDLAIPIGIQVLCKVMFLNFRTDRSGQTV